MCTIVLLHSAYWMVLMVIVIFNILTPVSIIPPILDPVPATCYLGCKFKSVVKFMINDEMAVLKSIINLCISV